MPVIKDSNNIIILTPVYNDWICYYQLQSKIGLLSPLLKEKQLHFVVVDDFSSEDCNPLFVNTNKTTIVHLVRNLGHQRALAIGLSWIRAEFKEDFSSVITMDSDGEDKPEDIIRLLKASEEDKCKSIIFAYRKSRSEKFTFRVCYFIYKKIFYLLTGKSIGFGNFSLIPKEAVKKLVHVSELWNNYPSSIIKSKLKYATIPTNKGKRYDGRSKMNLISLIIHGLSAVAVYIETVSVRLILFFVSLIISSLFGIFLAFGVKYFTNNAIPGWATNVMLGLIIVLAQAFIATILLTFIILSNRNLRNVIPISDYKEYVREENN